HASGIAIASGRDAYLTRLAKSTDFPTTAGAFQTSNGGALFDAFVTKLNATGSALLYSTYLRGPKGSSDLGSGIAVDSSGDAYLTGQTVGGLPTTARPLPTRRRRR